MNIFKKLLRRKKGVTFSDVLVAYGYVYMGFPNKSPYEEEEKKHEMRTQSES